MFRFAAPCAGGACRHFDGADGRQAARIVELSPVEERLPRCQLRPRCRWRRREGKAACLRCPGIATETCRPDDAMRRAAAPAP